MLLNDFAGLTMRMSLPAVVKIKFIYISRSSRPEVFLKKVFLEIYFAKFTGRHLCQGVFFNACNFIEKDTLTEHIQWLLLYLNKSPYLIPKSIKKVKTICS